MDPKQGFETGMDPNRNLNRDRPEQEFEIGMDPKQGFETGMDPNRNLNRDRPEQEFEIGMDPKQGFETGMDPNRNLNRDRPEQEFEIGMDPKQGFETGIDPRREFKNWDRPKTLARGSRKASGDVVCLALGLDHVRRLMMIPRCVPFFGHWRCCRNEVVSSLLCPWGGGVFDLPEVGFVAGVVAHCSARCQLCRRSDCSLLGMPQSCDEGLDLCGGAPTYPEGSKIRVCRSSCVCCTCDPDIISPDARPSGLLLALDGHIETFSKVPKRLYQLFDAPVNLGPFSSSRLKGGCCAHPNFISSGHACAKQRGLGVSTFPGTRDGHT
ncbi:hypothetical protein CRG98_016043 [Punica granatum]|uniref:Uncharacterized protein n=1 Tax=Punica granatum TaxID=22663 RepID=A0A2I0K600_PUNGR|nr:hypothetical protein CRG98_016043 [Punica granatum]